MPSNNSKYSAEMREETARYIIENGLTATSWAKEHGVDKNAVCRWVREYKRARKILNYPKSQNTSAKMEPLIERELEREVHELKKKLKQTEMDLEKEQEKVEILIYAIKVMRQQITTRINE